jgi:hypothetical protein
MYFFINEDNVRPGNRGGRDLFNWNDVRLLNNKDRESYLGVTQSIGFLDKGGKWRKKDWWLTHKGDNNIDKEEIENEKMKIKQEEERLIREKISGKLEKPAVKKEQQLTEYEMKELLKKEANFNAGDAKLTEFYDNDEYKPGLGIKQNISFRTNPYDKNTDLTKLEGIANTINIENIKKKDLSAYLDEKDLAELKKPSKQEEPIVTKTSMSQHKKEKSKKSSERKYRSRSRDRKQKRSRSKDKNDKMEKRKKRSKSRDRKEKHRKRSHSRSHERHRKHK